MPDVYVEISRRASYAPAPKLIHWAENNPVVAAYGTAHELEFSGRVPTLEWDVFLDPYLVKRVEIVLNEKEAFIQRQTEAREKASKTKVRDENATDSTEEGDGCAEESSPSQPTSYSSERLVLKYYDTEIRRRTALLVDRMLIAHGNVLQLIIEQTGYIKKYNFSRVKRTRKTLGGGIFARQWLAVYSEAMKLGLCADDLDFDDDSIGSETTESIGTHDDTLDDDKDIEDDHSESSKTDQVSRGNPIGPPKKIYMRRDTADEDVENEDDDMSDDGSMAESAASEPSPPKRSRASEYRDKRSRRRRVSSRTPKKRQNADDAVITSLNEAAVVPDKTVSESIQLLKQIMQCSAPFGLLLDMKSRHVSRRVWALVVDFLRDAGARVEGIGKPFRCVPSGMNILVISYLRHNFCSALKLPFLLKRSETYPSIVELVLTKSYSSTLLVMSKLVATRVWSKEVTESSSMLDHFCGTIQTSMTLWKLRISCYIDCNHALMANLLRRDIV